MGTILTLTEWSLDIRQYSLHSTSLNNFHFKKNNYVLTFVSILT